MHTISITALFLADSIDQWLSRNFNFFQLFVFSFDRCTIIINFCYLLLLQKCARLFVFLFRRDHSWTISFSFSFPPMNPSWHQSFLIMWCIASFHFSTATDSFLSTHYMPPINPHLPTQSNVLSSLCKYIKHLLHSFTSFFL